MVRHHADNLPRTHLRGLCEHLLLLLPSQPTGTMALDQLPGRSGGERGAAACACQAAAPAAVDSNTLNPVCQRRLSRRTDAFRIQRGADSADAQAADVRPTGRLSVRTPGSDRSRGHLRLDTGRPPGQLDGRPRGGQRRRTARRTAWLASGHPRWPRRRRPPAGGQSSVGLQYLRRSATHDGGDDTCRRGNSAAAQTARHEAAPRRTALLRGIGSRVLRKVMRQRRARQVWVRGGERN
jgi:hypothetical protein